MKVLLLADDLTGATLDPAGLWLADVLGACRRYAHRVQAVCSAADGIPGRDAPWPGLVIQRTDAHTVDLALADALADPPDIVHIAAPGPFNARVLESLAEFPVVLDLHDYWPICPQFDLFQRPHRRACAHHHPFEGCRTCTDRERLRSMDERGVLVECARMIIARSEPHRARIAEALGRPVERLDYGVDPVRFSPEAAAALSEPVRVLTAHHDRPRVIVLGPPTAARGAELLVDLLVALAARVPGVEMVVAGTDPDDPNRARVLREEARALGLSDRLVTLPVIAPGDLPALLTSGDVGVSPGLAPEPGGLFVMQALAAGLPVVAHPSGAVEELLSRHATGVLAEATDIARFSSAVAALLGDAVERERHADTGRLAAIEHHDLERAMFALDGLWRRVAAGPARAAA